MFHKKSPLGGESTPYRAGFTSKLRWLYSPPITPSLLTSKLRWLYSHCLRALPLRIPAGSKVRGILYFWIELVPIRMTFRLSAQKVRRSRITFRDTLERCFEAASTYASSYPRTVLRDSLEVCFNASADYAATVKALLNLPVLSVLPDLLPSSIFVRTSM